MLLRPPKSPQWPWLASPRPPCLLDPNHLSVSPGPLISLGLPYLQCKSTGLKFFVWCLGLYYLFCTGALSLCYILSLSLCPFSFQLDPLDGSTLLLAGSVAVEDFIVDTWLCSPQWNFTLLCVLACVGIVPIFSSLRRSLYFATPLHLESLGWKEVKWCPYYLRTRGHHLIS